MGMGWRAILGVVAALAVAIGAAGSAAAQSAESAGMITELKPGKGKVEVRAAGGADWRPARPLTALRAGDAVRASDNAMAVVLLTGGRGTVKVEAARSPYVVPAPQPGDGKAQKARALLASLAAGSKEAPQAVLSTRSAARPPVVFTPRNTPILPEPLVFEWRGSRLARHTVKIVGPAGVVFERRDLRDSRLEYPADAPRLAPGVRYTIQIQTATHPPQEAWFEVLDRARADEVRRDLAELEQALGPAVSPNTLVATRAALLSDRGLRHNARLLLSAALRSDPDEPTLHLLLASLDAGAGLSDQAAESLDEASFLLGDK